jgi:hypothetical protein
MRVLSDQENTLTGDTTMELTDRQREVLRAIIQDYILSAEPVGSRSVARKYGFRMSPGVPVLCR